MGSSLVFFVLACKSSHSVAGKAKYKLKRLQERASGHNAECMVTEGLAFSETRIGAAESEALCGYACR